jgi:hypothetical protein
MKMNELLIVYKKGSEMEKVISSMLEGSYMKEKMVNKQIIFDTIGDYTMIGSDETDIVKITNTLKKECLG